MKSESLDRVSNTASEPESAEAPGARDNTANNVEFGEVVRKVDGVPVVPRAS